MPIYERIEWSLWRTLASSAVTGLAALFVAYLFVLHWADARLWMAAADPARIVVALAALLGSTIGSAILFSSGVEAHLRSERRSDGRKLMASFLASQIGKYIPGRVWSVVLQRLLSGPALPTTVAILVNLELAGLAIALTIGAAITFVAWEILGFVAGLVVFISVIWGLNAALVFNVTAATATWLRRYFNRVSYALPSKPTKPSRRRSQGRNGLLLYAIGYCVGWLCLIWAGEGGDFHSALRLSALLSLSYVVGVLSLLPAGLGAREAALLAMGAWLVPEPTVVAAIAVITRLAMLVVETAATLLGACLLMRSRKS